MDFRTEFKKNTIIRIGSLWIRGDRVESMKSESTSNISKKNLVIVMFSGETHSIIVDKSEVDKIVKFVVNS